MLPVEIASSTTSAPFFIQIAQAKDEVEACYDIRLAGKSLSSWVEYHALTGSSVFAVEQVSQ
jgi:hypothetical protein